MWQINSCSLHEYHLSEVTGSCVVLLPGGADHAGSAAVWWSDSNAARRPAPEYYDPEGAAGSQFQLTDCWQAVSMNDWHLKHCSLMFTVVYCEIPQGFLYMIKSVFSCVQVCVCWKCGTVRAVIDLLPTKLTAANALHAVAAGKWNTRTDTVPFNRPCCTDVVGLTKIHRMLTIFLNVSLFECENYHSFIPLFTDA